MILCWMMRKSSKCKRINRDNKAKAKLSKNNEKLTNKEMLGLLVIGEEFYITYQSKKYWISQTEDFIVLTKYDGSYNTFDSVLDFDKRARIDGETIQTLWEQLTVQ